MTSQARRPGITLIEVLVAIFVMSIGLLCVLTLFVLGAQRMASSFKDDGATRAVINARAIANMKNVRGDPSVVANWPNPDANFSIPVFVDPAGSISSSPTMLGQNIPRLCPSFAPDSSASSMRFFGLLDDITFQVGSGVPRKFGSNIEREMNFTWAYLVQRVRANDASSTNVTVAVFQRRPKAGALETEYAASYYASENAIKITPPPANLTSGMWALDSTAGRFATFYRITGVRDDGTGVKLDLQTPLPASVTDGSVGQVIILDGLAEAFDIGTGR